VVLIGEGQMKKLMETVEAVTDDLERPDPFTETAEQMEVDQDMDAMDRKETEEQAIVDLTSATGVGSTAGVEAAPLNRLIMKGAEFLMNLNYALAEGSASPRSVFCRWRVAGRDVWKESIGLAVQVHKA
jgi:hypothetical protein